MNDYYLIGGEKVTDDLAWSGTEANRGAFENKSVATFPKAFVTIRHSKSIMLRDQEQYLPSVSDLDFRNHRDKTITVITVAVIGGGIGFLTGALIGYAKPVEKDRYSGLEQLENGAYGGLIGLGVGAGMGAVIGYAIKYE